MKDLTWLKTRLIAHRGLYQSDQSVPENSMLAFQKAMDHGYGIELDVNLLKDQTVVAFHDHHLYRACGKDVFLSEVTYSEIKSLTVFKTKEKIPRLTDVLALVSGQVPLLIELKPKRDIIGLCEAVMRDLSSYQGEYAVFSFHPKAVGWFKKYHPNVIRGQIAECFRNDSMHPLIRYLLRTMFFNRFTQPDFVSYGIHDLPNRTLNRLKKKNMTIISYAAKTQAEFDHVIHHYDNVVFEHFIPKR